MYATLQYAMHTQIYYSYTILQYTTDSHNATHAEHVAQHCILRSVFIISNSIYIVVIIMNMLRDMIS